MAAVGLSPEQTEMKIRDLGLKDAVCVACLNSLESVTISGNFEAIEKVVADLSGQGVFVRKIRSGDRAYHSPHMKDVGSFYEKMLSEALGLQSKDLQVSVDREISNQTTMISTTHGNFVDARTTK